MSGTWRTTRLRRGNCCSAIILVFIAQCHVRALTVQKLPTALPISTAEASHPSLWIHHNTASLYTNHKQTALHAASSSQPPENLPGPDDTTEETIRGLFSLWNYALATGEPRIVTKRYAKDAVLMPSISDAPRMDPESIHAYYEDYLLQKPQKRVIEGRIRIGHGWAEDAGVCEIRLLAATDGNRKPFKARYSFVYV